MLQDTLVIHCLDRAVKLAMDVMVNLVFWSRKITNLCLIFISKIQVAKILFNTELTVIFYLSAVWQSAITVTKEGMKAAIVVCATARWSDTVTSCLHQFLRYFHLLNIIALASCIFSLWFWCRWTLKASIAPPVRLGPSIWAKKTKMAACPASVWVSLSSAPAQPTTEIW